MNITQKFKDIFNKIKPKSLDGQILFKFGNKFEITSTLNDKQMEAFVLMLTNDTGLEFMLEHINDINPEQFQRVINSIKLKNLENEYLEKEDPNQPIVPVVSKNE